MGVGLEVAEWRSLAVSVAGAGHRTRGVGCEDASCVEVIDVDTLVLVVADGAGSARLAAEGSSRAVAAAMETLRAGAPLDDVMDAARSSLEPVVDGERLGDRATTLLVVRVGGGVVETAQVGDGAVVLRREGVLEVLAPDDKGEYLNETCFLTSDGWRDSMRRSSVPADGVDGVAAMTDGLQLVAFDLSAGVPHAPFFEPFFSYVADDGEVEGLASFLGSERVAARTDDDVTLVVAVRAEGRRRERQRADGR